jgi:hypothetical protein
MNRYWSVAQGYVSWKGNWEGIAPGWKGRTNHGYEVLISDLATPAARARWIGQIEEKLWCSLAAAEEFKQIVGQIEMRHQQ